MERLKRGFREGSALTRLIYINLGLFALIKVVALLFALGGADETEHLLLTWLGVPAWPGHLLQRPWTLLTYMFTHFGFTHILFNLLWLYWFGSIFREHFSNRQLTGVYLLGGIFGAALYILVYNTIPAFTELRHTSWAIGASASVMALVFAVCTYLPNHRIYLFLLGPVKLIHLAIFTAVIDLLSIPGGNAGGHIAHLGGALFGYLFTLGIRKNYDITAGFMAFFHSIGRFFLKPSGPSSRSKARPATRPPAGDREYREQRRDNDRRVNEILDKISRSGYESLSREEKELLFKSGRK